MRYYVIKVGRTPLKTLKIGGLIDQKVSQMTIKRRFIAGAKCPKCEALDRVVMLISGDDEWIECIECGYSENRPTHIDEPQLPEIADEVGVIQFKPRQPK